MLAVVSVAPSIIPELCRFIEEAGFLKMVHLVLSSWHLGNRMSPWIFCSSWGTGSAQWGFVPRFNIRYHSSKVPMIPAFSSLLICPQLSLSSAPRMGIEMDGVVNLSSKGRPDYQMPTPVQSPQQRHQECKGTGADRQSSNWREQLRMEYLGGPAV